MKPFGKLELTLAFLGMLGIMSYESTLVHGTGLESVTDVSHQCTCVYNKTYPIGHCACNPPLPGTGNSNSGLKVKGITGLNNPTGTINCECVYNRTHPRGHCNCDSELCYKDFCVSG